MAIRRTLKQKQKAQLQRNQQVTYQLPQAKRKASQLPVITQPEPTAARVPHSGPSLHEVFGYAPSLLWRDILKTLITTIMVVGILLALRYSPAFQ